MNNIYTLHTDGGARGNPGPAGIGGVIKDESTSEILFEFSDYIGEATNNVAEYKGLLKGLTLALEKNIAKIKCYLDSELIVKQINGQYRVKDANLKILFDQVVELKSKFQGISFTHVPRKENKKADELVNKALDLWIEKSK